MPIQKVFNWLTEQGADFVALKKFNGIYLAEWNYKKSGIKRKHFEERATDPYKLYKKITGKEYSPVDLEELKTLGYKSEIEDYL